VSGKLQNVACKEGGSTLETAAQSSTVCAQITCQTFMIL
jgi:hypothetical protein